MVFEGNHQQYAEQFYAVAEGAYGKAHLPYTHLNEIIERLPLWYVAIERAADGTEKVVGFVTFSVTNEGLRFGLLGANPASAAGRAAIKTFISQLKSVRGYYGLMSGRVASLAVEAGVPVVDFKTAQRLMGKPKNDPFASAQRDIKKIRQMGGFADSSLVTAATVRTGRVVHELTFDDLIEQALLDGEIPDTPDARAGAFALVQDIGGQKQVVLKLMIGQLAAEKSLGQEPHDAVRGGTADITNPEAGLVDTNSLLRITLAGLVVFFAGPSLLLVSLPLALIIVAGEKILKGVQTIRVHAVNLVRSLLPKPVIDDSGASANTPAKTLDELVNNLDTLFATPDATVRVSFKTPDNQKVIATLDEEVARAFATAQQHGVRIMIAGGDARRALLGQKPTYPTSDVDLIIPKEIRQNANLFGRIEFELRHIYKKSVSVQTYGFDDIIESGSQGGFRPESGYTIDKFYITSDGVVQLENGQTPPSDYLADLAQHNLRLTKVADKYMIKLPSILRGIRFMAEHELAVDAGTDSAIREFVSRVIQRGGVNLRSNQVKKALRKIFQSTAPPEQSIALLKQYSLYDLLSKAGYDLEKFAQKDFESGTPAYRDMPAQLTSESLIAWLKKPAAIAHIQEFNPNAAIGHVSPGQATVLIALYASDYDSLSVEDRLSKLQALALRIFNAKIFYQYGDWFYSLIRSGIPFAKKNDRNNVMKLVETFFGQEVVAKLESEIRDSRNDIPRNVDEIAGLLLGASDSAVDLRQFVLLRLDQDPSIAERQDSIPPHLFKKFIDLKDKAWKGYGRFMRRGTPIDNLLIKDRITDSMLHDPTLIEVYTEAYTTLVSHLRITAGIPDSPAINTLTDAAFDILSESGILLDAVQEVTLRRAIDAGLKGNEAEAWETLTYLGMPPADADYFVDSLALAAGRDVSSQVMSDIAQQTLDELTLGKTAASLLRTPSEHLRDAEKILGRSLTPDDRARLHRAEELLAVRYPSGFSAEQAAGIIRAHEYFDTTVPGIPRLGERGADGTYKKYAPALDDAYRAYTADEIERKARILRDGGFGVEDVDVFVMSGVAGKLPLEELVRDNLGIDLHVVDEHKILNVVYPSLEELLGIYNPEELRDIFVTMGANPLKLQSLLNLYKTKGKLLAEDVEGYVSHVKQLLRVNNIQSVVTFERDMDVIGTGLKNAGLPVRRVILTTDKLGGKNEGSLYNTIVRIMYDAKKDPTIREKKGRDKINAYAQLVKERIKALYNENPSYKLIMDELYQRDILPFVPSNQNVLFSDVGFKGTLQFFAAALYELHNPNHFGFVDLFFTIPSRDDSSRFSEDDRFSDYVPSYTHDHVAFDRHNEASIPRLLILGSAGERVLMPVANEAQLMTFFEVLVRHSYAYSALNPLGS